MNTTASPNPEACEEFDWSKVENAITPLEQATHLPAEVYTSQAVFNQERERIFFKNWIVMCRTDEIPNAGDYLAMDLVGEPLLICRNRNGQLKAFFNSCRHRGVAVAKGRGNTRSFVCPAHAWSYDLDGKLLGALRPNQIKWFDLENCRLPEVKVDAHAGFVFVNLDPNAPGLSDYLAEDDFQEHVAPFCGENLITVDKYSFEIDANWKIAMETLADVYHVEVVHRATFGKSANGYKPQTDTNLTFTRHGATKRYSSPTFAPEGVPLFGPMPWLADHPAGDTLALSFYLRPNVAFFGRCDMIQPCIVHPVATDRSVVTCWTCMPAEFCSDPEYARKVKLIADFCRQVNEEDKALILSIQNGLHSRAYPDGPIHELERIVHHRTKAYVAAMTGREI